MHKDAMEIEASKQKYQELFENLKKKNHMIKKFKVREWAFKSLRVDGENSRLDLEHSMTRSKTKRNVLERRSIKEPRLSPLS